MNPRAPRARTLGLKHIAALERFASMKRTSALVRTGKKARTASVVTIQPRRRRFTGGFGLGNVSRRPEWKLSETTVSGNPVNNAGTILAAISIGQGSTLYTRTGNKIEHKRLSWRINFQNDTTATSNFCQAWVLVDKQPPPAGALPAIADLISGTDSCAYINVSALDRFKILRHVKWTMVGAPSAAGAGAGPSSGTGGGSTYIWEDSIKTGFGIKFLDGVGNTEENNILFVAVGDNAPGTADVAIPTGRFRSRFTDL